MQYTRNGFLFPEGFDLVRDGSNIIEQLCRTLDPEPVDMAPLVTASAGWTIDAALITHIGPFVYWKMDLTRQAGATITTDAGGNIAPDIAVFTGLPDPYKPYRMVSSVAQPTYAPVSCVHNNTHNLMGYVDQTGACWLTHGWPGQTYAAGSGYRIWAWYLLNF